MENLFANTGIGKHIIRTHHWGIVLPTLEKAEAFMKTFGLQEDYRGHVKAYDADLIFTKHGNGVDAVEFIIPLSGVLTEFNKGKGGIAHVAYLSLIHICQQELEVVLGIKVCTITVLVEFKLFCGMGQKLSLIHIYGFYMGGVSLTGFFHQTAFSAGRRNGLRFAPVVAQGGGGYHGFRCV